MKDSSIDVVVDGVRCKWDVMTSYDDKGNSSLVCLRYPVRDDSWREEYSKYETAVPVPRPSLDTVERGALEDMSDAFDFDDGEREKVRELLERIKYSKEARAMLARLAAEDTTKEEK